ncbi:hypothetical protein Trydic_g3592 [Trypoxylus dichotomus]
MLLVKIVLVLVVRFCKEAVGSKDTSFIVRLCLTVLEREQHIFCLGVYVHKDVVVAGDSCAEYINIEGVITLLMGSDEMDCVSGQIRKPHKFFYNEQAIFKILFVRLQEPFTLSSRVALALVVEDQTADGTCTIYCSFRTTKPDQGMRNPYIEGSLMCGIRNKSYLELMDSPVICNRRLCGFLGPPTEFKIVIFPIMSFLGMYNNARKIIEPINRSSYFKSRYILILVAISVFCTIK